MTLSRVWNRHQNRSTAGAPGKAGFNARWKAVFSSRTPSDPRFIGQRTCTSRIGSRRNRSGILSCTSLTSVAAIFSGSSRSTKWKSERGSASHILNPTYPGQPAVERFGWRFQIGDKVIQTENDYDKDMFNGDAGIVERIDAVEQQVAVRFDERLVKYDFGGLDG